MVPAQGSLEKRGGPFHYLRIVSRMQPSRCSMTCFDEPKHTEKAPSQTAKQKQMLSTVLCETTSTVL
jgi:hypothetical protein